MSTLAGSTKAEPDHSCMGMSSACRLLQMLMFSIGAMQALAAALSPACRWCVPQQKVLLTQNRHSWLPQHIAVHVLLSSTLAAATVIIWLACRSTAWAWLLQDLLGVCLIVLLLRQFRLPSLKVCRHADAWNLVTTRAALSAPVCSNISAGYTSAPFALAMQVLKVELRLHAPVLCILFSRLVISSKVSFLPIATNLSQLAEVLCMQLIANVTWNVAWH